MVEITNQLMRKLTTVQRRKLVEHIDGPVAIERKLKGASHEHIRDYLPVDALRRLGLLNVIPHLATRPTHSELTVAGREAVARILAECAEMLVAAGALDVFFGAERPIDVLARLKLTGAFLPHEAREVAEAEELDESGKLAL